MDKNYCVYEIVNTWNNKRYIGITNNFNIRKSQHFNAKYRQKENKKVLYKAMKTFGESYFEMSLLFSGLTKDDAAFAESYLINNLPTYAPYGYNKAKELYQLNKSSNFLLVRPELKSKLDFYLKTKKKSDIL